MGVQKSKLRMFSDTKNNDVIQFTSEQLVTIKQIDDS